MQQDELIAAAKAALDHAEAVRGLFLAGSFGRGTADEWSDVDLLAVVAPDRQREVADLWRVALPKITPVVYWNELDRGGILLNAVAEDWLRCDLSIVAPDRMGQRAKDTIRPLIDRDGIYDRLLATLPRKAPDARALNYQINEFIRVLGLTPVAIGRGEYVTGVMGTGLLRGLLTDLFMHDVTDPDPGGILHMSKLLSREQVGILTGLPYPAANGDEVIAANMAVARAFMPRARALAQQLGVEWPAAFEEATKAVLRRKLGLEADW